MKRYTTIVIASLACVMLCVPLAQARNYAVLISAGRTTADDTMINSEYWYDMFLQYKTLLDEGYSHDDIYVLYGYGTNFGSRYPCYQATYTVPDYAVSRANIQVVFGLLSGIMTQDDFLYVWWMGHGGPSGSNLVMYIETTGESVYDHEIATWLDPVDYDIRSFSWMTCFSGGILDDVEGPRSIAMSSATFYESTYSDWLCDTVHAEFHYPETCAWHWETPCGICGPVDADTSGDGAVSFEEAFIYARDHTINSHPQMSDQGGLAPDTYLSEQGEDILPENYTIIRGQHVSGGLTDLFYSDDSYLLLWPNLFLTPTEPPVQVVVEGTATARSPAELTFTLEAYATTTALVQTIELYDYVAGSYELVDTRNAALSDSVAEVTAPGDLSRFIDPTTQQMKARLSWQFGPLGIYAFDVGIDRTVWTITMWTVATPH